MRVQVRASLVTLVVCALVALVPDSAQAFGIERFFAGNCKEEGCGKEAKAPTEAEEAVKGYRAAGGDVPFGVTDFVIKTEPKENKILKEVFLLPEGFLLGGSVSALRTDVAPGVVTNPEAVPMCSQHAFGVAAVAGTFVPPSCPENSIIGVNKVLTAAEFPEGSKEFVDAPLTGTVYNLEPSIGLASEFGVAIPLGKEATIKGKKVELYAHTLIEGNVEWGSDYHDYFTIKGIAPGLIESRLIFKGTQENTFGFLRNPTACTKGPSAETRTTLTVENALGQKESKPYENKVGSEPCNLNFSPGFALTSETAAADSPDGITATVTAAHPANAEEADTAALRTAKIVLPEGMTMNPSAAAGLTGCTRSQVGIETRNATKCPSSSRIGSVEIEVPTLPAHSLSGPIFLGQPEEGGTPKSITGPPYTIYLDAESARYGVKVRIEGVVSPNANTGRLETTFKDTSQTPNNIPQQPFNEAILHFNGGPFASVANPLVCGTAKAQTAFEPFSGSTVSPVTGELPFTTEGCSTFAPKQSTTVLPSTAGATSNFTFKIERPEGQPYLEQVATVLPPGVVGKIPTVPLCSEAQSLEDNCPATSQIGTVQAAAGSGEPFTFNGTVYLTGPYKGAPYGLLFKVPVVAGPFNLGTEYVHAKIQVNPNTARVIVTTAELPLIRGGIPTRLRSMTVEVNRPNYILNPTNCGELKTESTVTSSTLTESPAHSTVLASSPFQVENCSALPFKPTFTASTSAKASKANGASITTTMTQAPGQANIKSVLVQLPKQLPSRLSTLNKACLAKTFEENPYNCSKESMVGTATAVTPVLPNVMKGPAIFVSHAGEEFPSLELVLEADGVRVIVEGKTHISKGITTTNYAATPDVPVSSITVNLPLGPFSALGLERPGKTNLCTEKLVMPTTITGQNGVVVKQKTIITPSECPVQIIGHKVVDNSVWVTVRTYSAGRISGSGPGLITTSRTLSAASKSTTLKIPLSSTGLSKRRPFKVKVRIGFVPKQKGVKTSSATVTVKF